MLNILVVFVILFLRAPAKLLVPQLWAEDGAIFFKDAYQLPFWENLFKPSFGYLQIIQRLIAGVTVGSHLYVATPLIWNVLSLLMASVMIGFFGTQLYEKLIPQKQLRWLLMVLAAAGGSQPEILGNLANIHTYFGLLGLHLLVWLHFFSSKNVKLRWLWSTLIFLVVVSSPQAFLMVPLVFLEAWRQRHTLGKTSRLFVAAFALGIVAQTVSYSWNQYQTVHSATFASNILSVEQLGAKPELNWKKVSRVVTTRELIQNLIPYNVADQLIAQYLVVVFAAGIIFISYSIVIKKKTLVFWVVAICVMNVLMLLVARPIVLADIARIGEVETYVGGRYFYISYVAVLLLGVVALAESKFQKPLILFCFFVQVVAGLLFFPSAIHEENFNWFTHARALEGGSRAPIPINPHGWKVELDTPF